MYSPALPERNAFSDWAFREADLLVIEVQIYGDGEGHAGTISDEGTTRLYRDGELVASASRPDGGRFDVPPEPATYRVEIDTRQSAIETSARQTVAWTFQSGHVSGEPARLPLLVVRFTPELSAAGRAPGGSAFTLPLHVDQYGRESPPEIVELSVEVSYDDGATWSEAIIAPDGTGWNALLEHPSGAQYVSLRATARDALGNAVEQSVTRAYGLAQTPAGESACLTREE